MTAHRSNVYVARTITTALRGIEYTIQIDLPVAPRHRFIVHCFHEYDTTVTRRFISFIYTSTFGNYVVRSKLGALGE